MSATIEDIKTKLEQVKDPEIPVLTIRELGILQDVSFVDDTFIITITPSYVGCPAMNMIEHYIKLCMDEEGIENYEIKTVLHPAWTTDWITDEGKEKLRQYGIAAPVKERINGLLVEKKEIPCPLCGSIDTKMISRFGATACKAQYQCNTCLEPFEYFKCH